MTENERKSLWRQNNPDKVRSAKLKHKFGITLKQFNTWMEIQNGCCAICETKMTKPNVDHDHKDGHFRGILCWRCNASIGKFNDDPALLEKAAQYLRTH